MPSKKNEKLHPFYSVQNMGKKYFPGDHSEFSLHKTPRPEVVFVGDSITEYWCCEHPDFFQRNNFLVHGVCGETSQNILQRFQTDATDGAIPIIALLCGINDFTEPQNINVESKIIHNITAMCDEAFLSGARIIISALIPCVAIPWAPHIPNLSEKIVCLNACLRSLSRQRHLPFADYHTAMALPDNSMRPEFTNDGCHPNSEGFCVMESIIIRQIELLTNRTNTYYITPSKLKHSI
ncbi:MAG: GDSL-type esterase/lipase family protein [Bacteroidaceae bacterium]|jgi:lysophospholipase L1-like esterase|nr:GDSL-type esterase/lipase family protein [Bacteroidaceae bacterium]